MNIYCPILRYMILTWIKFARHYSILFALTEKQNRGFGVKSEWEIRHQVFRNGSRPGDFSPREINNEAKERRTANDTTRPNWHFSRCAFISNLILVACACLWYSASCLSHAKRKMKKRDIRSLSQKQRARSRCLFFSTPHTSRPGGSWRIRNHCEHCLILLLFLQLLLIFFYNFKYVAKGLKDVLRFFT